ncbi:MAG: hypothetical protein ABIH92_04445, partial [Nanoarchaeota archaeon]
MSNERKDAENFKLEFCPSDSGGNPYAAAVTGWPTPFRVTVDGSVLGQIVVGEGSSAFQYPDYGWDPVELLRAGSEILDGDVGD